MGASWNRNKVLAPFVRLIGGVSSVICPSEGGESFCHWHKDVLGASVKTKAACWHTDIHYTKMNPSGRNTAFKNLSLHSNTPPDSNLISSQLGPYTSLP